MCLTPERYRHDPCGTISIPYWKYKTVQIPNNMRIVHDRDFIAKETGIYTDEPYFRLYHALDCVDASVPEWLEVKTVSQQDLQMVADIINRSYLDIQISAEQLYALTKTAVYDKDLWILAFQKTTGAAMGCAIADFDASMEEGILEWIQVLPEYRERRVGKTMVNQLLMRMKGKAAFATVSGKRNAVSEPEKLYRSCGFTGTDIWHILKICDEKEN